MSVIFLPKNALIHDFGSKFSLQQNGNHLNAPFMSITMVQIPDPYLIPCPSYLHCRKVHSSNICILRVSSVKRWTHHILVCEWNMNLVPVRLWSAWKELSNDGQKCFFFVVSTILPRPKATIIYGFRVKMEIIWMLIAVVQIPPSYLIPSPRYLAKYIKSTQHLT